MIKVLVVLGTRPEAIKLGPVIHQFLSRPHTFKVYVCSTGQHISMPEDMLSVFAIKPDFELKSMVPGSSLAQSTGRLLASLDAVIKEVRPDIVLVQGDTTTTLCGALAAFYQGVIVGHVEAGLRTNNMRSPFPEEMNRILTTRLSEMHFAPTPAAAKFLMAEGVPSQRVWMTGNTGVDAIMFVTKKLQNGTLDGGKKVAQSDGRRVILLTAHRRENLDKGYRDICKAVKRLAERDDVQIVFPVHPNPGVRKFVKEAHLDEYPRITLTEPLGYVEFVDLMRSADIILTDSGGIQEEAPAMGKPVLVLRNETERPEAVDAGSAKLVGTDANKIVREVEWLLDNDDAYARMAQPRFPFGDGLASNRIADAVAGTVGRSSK